MSKKEIKLSLTLDTKTGKLVTNIKSAGDEVEGFTGSHALRGNDINI